MAAKQISFMKVLDMAAAVLVFMGGISWALMGLFEFNLIAWVLGSMPALTRTFYVLVGIAALYDFAMWEAIQKRWECSGFYGRAETPAS
ncbi:MAG: DUF378 domain-containing protein [Syntrophobacteraceae bacterium]|jgi:hypothetical protein|nr:DUF378 domain-containing protein [Syntrophobacteraceae bacterium]